MSFNPNGSEDKELKIKGMGIPDLVVGDYHRYNLPRQQEEAEKVLALARTATVLQKAKEKQLQQSIEDVLAADDLDEEDQDPTVPFVSVAELLRPQRLRRLPARDRYFTEEEAEAGDPRVVEDPADQTTESEDELGEGWDPEDSKDDDFDPDVVMEDIEIVQRGHNMSPSP
jgi:hypothetical protein